MTRKLVLLAFAVLLVLPATHAVAGKKKLKPWKSETATIAVAHHFLTGTSGEMVNVTIQEFINRCAVPATQGFDAAIFEVPAEYQKVAASASAVGSSSGLEGYDLDMYFYDASCTMVSASEAAGADELAYMPKGTTWIAVLNWSGDPNVSVHIELKDDVPATHAVASKKKKPKKPAECPAATYAEPASASVSRPAPDAKIIKVTDAATAAAPVTLEYEHGAALWDWFSGNIPGEQEGPRPILEDTKWFNIQVDSSSLVAGLNVRIDWAIPSPSDIDLHLWYGATGAQAAFPGSSNLNPVGPMPLMSPNGGMGWESIRGFAVPDCSTFLVESRAAITAGEAMTLTIWLGEPTF